MKEITFRDPHRQKHFEHFLDMNHPHYTITARVEISRFLAFIKGRSCSFTPAMVYLISRTANELPAFRQRIRDRTVVEHESVHPSFTVNTSSSEVFSFCYVPYRRDAVKFIASALESMERMDTDPSFADDPDRDDYLFLSSIPWIHFTGLEHAMSFHPHDSVPRITWGKYQEESGNIWMPLSVQAHHALVDGRHMGEFFNRLQGHLESDGWIAD